jgi:DNA primase
MAEGGILSKREFDGKYFDRFRNRIMFPIWDTSGTVIGFGGRILGKGEPKYLNSPETKVFNKRKNLYGYSMSRPAMRQKDQAVLFEGYVDVISAWNAGIYNGVATLGTSITDEQVRLIRRSAQSVIVCYDSDNAGVNAAFKAAQMLENAGSYVKVAQMPDGLDPDDYIQKYGQDRFQKDVIGASLTVMAFKLRYLRRGRNLQDEGERMQYIEEVLKEISSLRKAVERDHYLRQLANEFDLSIDALKQQQYQTYKQFRQKKDKENWNRDNNAKNQSILNKPLLPAFHNAERILLAYMLKDIDIAETVEKHVGGGFNIEEYSAIAAYLYAFYQEGNSSDISLFLQRLNDNRLSKVVSELAMMKLNENVSDQELQDYMKQVLNYPKWLQIQEKERDKTRAEREQNVVLAAQIAKEIVEMKKALKNAQYM